MNCSTIIQQLEQDNSRLAKEAILLAEAQAANTELFTGIRLALDPLVTFGIKQVPIKETASGNGLPWNEFYTLVTQLAERQLTGNAARDAVNAAMETATQDQWNNWFRRILIKDLRCGVSEKTVNKIVSKRWPEYSVPVFTVQLAHDSANHETKVTGKKYIEVKLDGVRVVTIVYPNGRVDQFSRNGKELVNFAHITQQISKVANKFTEPIVLDGEVMSGTFQDLMKQIHRKSNIRSQDAVLHLFDMITLKEFEAGKCQTSQELRSKQVYDWHKANCDALPNVAVVGHELVDLDTAEGAARFKAINLQAIADGYEGLMIKDPTAPYELKRSVAWLKLKPFIEVTLAVTEVEEGTGKNQGRLGALVCSGVDDGKTITVNVGSGFTDEDRIEFWNNRADLIGHLVEVRADAVTQNQDGSYSLRFPRFLRFRGFEPGEKL